MISINRQGITRTVILTRNWAIKLPNNRYQHYHFLQGCSANWRERQLTKTGERYNGDNDFYKLITPTIFCSWFGLISIQRRCQPLTRNLSLEEVEIFKNLTTDIKKENFGINKDGELVCLDYA